MFEGTTKPQLLVAMPTLKDGYFDRSVIVLCEYNQAGAMGFVINSPSTTSVNDLLGELGLSMNPRDDRPIMIGGPVQPELCWVMHTPDYDGESTTALGEHLSLSAAQEVLTQITDGNSPHQYILGVGYAGWGPGQLDREIEDESWWLVDDIPPLDVLQHNCENRWDIVMKELGLSKKSYYTQSYRA